MTTINKTIAAAAADLSERLAIMGIPLDGSEASLRRLDDAIDLLWGESKPADDVFDGMVWGYGCYVADVIQRHHAGNWQRVEDIGYDFVPADGAMGVNPWVWVEKRFLFGEPLAAAYQAVASARTNLCIRGVGLSISFMKIDHEYFRLLTEAGLAEADYQVLLDDVEDEGDHVEGLLIDHLSVTVDGEVFTCSWDKIEPQLHDRCLLPQKPYERLKAGEYLLVYERDFESRWDEVGVEDYSPSRLQFKVESVQPSQGVEHLLMDFKFRSDAPEYVATYGETGNAYVVDRQGNRHTIKVAYEW